jgi:long-chain fatty acid transport protein
MKRTIKLAVAAAVALTSTAAFATNGDHLIGLGAKARGMGGVAIGMSHGAESALANPALITTVKDTEVSFGGTVFMPDVSYEMKTSGAPYNGGSVPAGTTLATGDSDADMSMIPEVSVASNLGNGFYAGIGMWGTAGMGVDYRGQGGMEMVTNLQLMQFGVPLAYKMGGISVGITPIMQYGALDINYDADPASATGQTGAGVAQDFGYGYTAGAAYSEEGLTIGAVYKSAIEMEYKGQLSGATQPFVGFGIFPAAMGDKLEQPAEMGVGASYTFSGNTIAVDYKKIKWSDAKGYKDFGWDDQNVYAVGYEYNAGKWAVRLGYNHAKGPIKDLGAVSGSTIAAPADMATLGGNAMNMFNLLGFPATVEDHYTIGGTYALNDKFSLDLAYMYAPEVSTTLATMPIDSNTDGAFDADTATTVKHSQQSVSFQLNFAF